ncbi:MAG: carotenoid biosynthesis protein, partial [Bacteroidota bacterium]
RLSIILLLILFPSGFIFHNISFTKEYVLSMTDIFLLAVNSLVFYFVWKASPSIRLMIWSISAFLITFLLEYAGVETGKVFGNYHYGETMFLQLGKVPVVIAFNWTILILATYSISNKLVNKPWIIPVISSVLIVIFDYIMEPVAMYLDYWQWENNTIPLQNYIAWFIISLVFAYALSILKIRPDSKILRYYFFIQLGFFVLFRIEMLFNPLIP